ncbi:MAG: hypothetical protein ABF289_16495 [Clostridiales bacterium]
MKSNNLDVSSLIEEGMQFKKKYLKNKCIFNSQEYYIWINKIELYFRNSIYLNLPVYKKFLSIYENNSNTIDSYNQIYSILKAIEYCESQTKYVNIGLDNFNINKYIHWTNTNKSKNNSS